MTLGVMTLHVKFEPDEAKGIRLLEVITRRGHNILRRLTKVERDELVRKVLERG